MKSDYGFVQLNRTFQELPKDTGESDSIDIARIAGLKTALNWDDLVQKFRIIILSEAGTGKTKEIQHIAECLRNEGKSAFFLRLEYVANDFEDAFEVGTLDDFNVWLASNSKGWLLLDSVDEARLRNPGDFELAIRKLGKRINSALQRAHIIITSRVSAWRAKTDLAYCIHWLPYIVPSVITVEDDEQPKKCEVRQHSQTEIQSQPKEEPSFWIVSLNDLDSAQIEMFASAKGIKDTKKFLEAVDRADAWLFTTRPQDLEELIEFWHDKGRIGSRLELMENTIERRLSERDQTRAENCPLSPARIREGVRFVAAALTLAKQSTVCVPDGADNTAGIPISKILPDWSEREQSVLLSRPIFDEAMYGTVRFHHRTVREFLTAEWLAGLLKREASRRKIEALLFRNQYGLEVIVPTMRPVLPWLVLFDAKICVHLCRVAPEVLLEGGDPGKLPLEMRRDVLRQICAQIAKEEFKGGIPHYSTVQRFASAEFTADVKGLFAQGDLNENLEWFLLGLVWYGDIKGALPEAKAYALSPSTAQYARIAAFRAVQGIGTAEDMDEVRASFFNESTEIKSKWLAELVYGLKPTPDNIEWLLNCLAKVEEEKQLRPTGLSEALVTFVQRAEIGLLSQFIQGLNRLLNIEPVLDRRHCKASQEFAWVLKPAANAIIKCIEARSSVALTEEALAILNKLATAPDYGVGKLDEETKQLAGLVPAWPELNYASFWYDARQAAERLNQKNGERLTSYWQVAPHSSFWRFGRDDFEYVVKEIVDRPALDDKFLVLSLAFDIYIKNGCASEQLDSLKRTVTIHCALEECLTRYLNPPQEEWRREEAKWKRQAAAQERKEAKNREEWRQGLQENVDKLRDNGLEPGKVSTHQHYLYVRMQEKDSLVTRYSNGDWRCLIDEFGEDIAQAYRDGVVRFWRGYQPPLLSEGALDNSTPFEVVFGLAGLEIEASESSTWPHGLSAEEIETACRYAFRELNEFPGWLSALFSEYPSVVCGCILKEIQWELTTTKRDVLSHYIISKMSWHAKWAWSELAPACYEILKADEPANISNLESLLKIITGSSISDRNIAELASIKSVSLVQPEHTARWFAIWVSVDPIPALAALESHLNSITTPEECTFFSMHFIVELLGSRLSKVSLARDTFKTPSILKRIYLLMHEYIRVAEDIKRPELVTYSPGLRDDAQDARNSLTELIRNIPGKEAYFALTEIAKIHPHEDYRSWFIRLAKEKAEMDADIEAWQLQDVLDFHEKLDRTPSSHQDLAELAYLRFLDLKDNLENGDDSIARTLQRIDAETEMRMFIGHILRDKAFGRYHIPQEEELADAKRPDLRFLGIGFDAPVPVELKLAQKWTGPALFERMENQLCGDYLRDQRSARGIFVLVHQGKQEHWQLPHSKKQVDFDSLVCELEKYWEIQLAPKFPNIDRIHVVGIDLTKRYSTKKMP